MEEIWKDIVGFEGMYQISNFGRVKSLTRSIYNSYNGKRILKGRIMKNLDLIGYKRIELCKEGKIYAWRVHRLVATMFIPNPNNYSEINHIDGDHSNNYVENLEWCTPKQNINHSYDNDFSTRNKKINLIRVSDNSEYYFRSLTKAGEFIGRNHNYIYQSLKNNRNIIGIDKNVYIVKMTQGETK